jgi:predicted component of type VI protein secretion system
MAESLTQTEGLAGVQLEGSEFSSLLQKEFKPKTDEAKSAVEQAVRTLAEQALSQTKLIGNDVIKSIEAIIAQLDHKLSEQVNLILHNEEFQKLEGSWRGLHYLVNNTETDEMLKIRFMNITKNELGRTLKRFKGTSWDQSPLFKKNMGSSAASLLVAWSATISSTIRRLMSNYWAKCPKFPLRRIRLSSPAHHPPACRWHRGRSLRIRAI